MAFEGLAALLDDCDSIADIPAIEARAVFLGMTKEDHSEGSYALWNYNLSAGNDLLALTYAVEDTPGTRNDPPPGCDLKLLLIANNRVAREYRRHIPQIITPLDDRSA